MALVFLRNTRLSMRFAGFIQRPEHSLRSEIFIDDVISAAAYELVLAGLAKERVVAAAAAKEVIAIAAMQFAGNRALHRNLIIPGRAVGDDPRARSDRKRAAGWHADAGSSEGDGRPFASVNLDICAASLREDIQVSVRPD